MPYIHIKTLALLCDYAVFFSTETITKAENMEICWHYNIIMGFYDPEHIFYWPDNVIHMNYSDA